ncbi:hypothetical protein VTK73DRAFT_10392 [Phialemonium thermophilum]|uniref:Transmembrane protein n=1 Tax=Phialemonium thermophilum TaxID=223376 RepID=A0ABR3XGR1_9PEZI
MGVLSPIHTLLFSVLCLVTAPLAIFAGITTMLAFSVLMLRAAAIYFDMITTSLAQYFIGYPRYPEIPESLSGTLTPTYLEGGTAAGYSRVGLPSFTPSYFTSVGAHMSPGYRTPRNRDRGGNSFASSGVAGAGMGFVSGSFIHSPQARSRRPSHGSGTSLGGTEISVGEGDEGVSGHGVVGLVSSFIPATSSGMDRDFEGVGGWRLDRRDDDSDWANINSRLELPLERSQRYHHRNRSSSTGATTPTEGKWLTMKGKRKDGSSEPVVRDTSRISPRKLRISPNSSRVRTGQSASVSFTPKDADEEYFGYFPPPLSPRSSKKTFG